MIYFLMLMIAIFIKEEFKSSGYKFYGNLFLALYITIFTIWIISYNLALLN